MYENIKVGYYDGPCFDPKLDGERLKKQSGRVFHVLNFGDWVTLREIEELTGDPQSSISAQIRHFRKPCYGSHIIEKRRRGDPSRGIWEYRLVQGDK